MQKEIECKYFINSKDEIRSKLKSIELNLKSPEFLMKRKAFCKKGEEKTGEYWRVRNEYNQITMTYKNIKNNTIDGVDEINLIIDDFENGCEMLSSTGLICKSYQETYREIWDNDEVEVVIDEWPCLQPYIEIEAENEDIIKKYAKLLGFNFEDCYFGGVDVLYAKQYNYPQKDINIIPVFTFNNDALKKELNKYIANDK
ncbi:MAG: CYTH domain-containing protein [Rickettsiales bacterium]|jgi:adenylate cyclase class 2|nr:CYTH domain-containing protein [Rickettsiales bacterium]